MSAQPNAHPRPSFRKLPASEPAVPSRFDAFGRDPSSASESLRTQSNYEADQGYSPLFHGMLADLSRLLGGSAVGWALIMNILRLSLGRGFDPKTKRRYVWSLAVSLDDLSDLCRCDVRQLQRQISELTERGVIKTKGLARGLYSFSLQFEAWRSLDDYAVWRRKQVVTIPSGEVEDADGDDAITEVSRDAVRLTRKPQMARPGRALRALSVKVGVRELVCQNASSSANVAFESVIEPGGRMVVSATFAPSVPADVEEVKASAPNPKPKPNRAAAAPSHPLAGKLVDLFDPILERFGVPFLRWDAVAWALACDELGEMPMDYLVHFVMKPKGRGSRSISNTRAVVAIVGEARKNWEHSRPRCSGCSQVVAVGLRGVCAGCTVSANISAWGEGLRDSTESEDDRTAYRGHLEAAAVNAAYSDTQRMAARRYLEL